MRKLALLILLTIAVAAVTLGKAMGEFRDVSRSEGNIVSTGEFDIRISKDNSRFYDELRVFKIEDLKPGDTRNISFFIKNYGDVPIGNVSLLIFVRDIEDEVSPAEKPYDLTPEKGELSSCIIVEKITVNSKNVLNSPTKLSDLVGKEIKLFTGNLESEETLEVKITMKLAEDAGNECMTDSTEVMMKIIATQ
ncbi:TasA family protein [Pyrococcus kukulkanii]|uniref:methyltransferase n=1 Tax=Pyrococcus kukulkanii TaxID=1609559 RepID=UPI00356155DC